MAVAEIAFEVAVDLRIAEAEAGIAERSDVVEIREIEMDLALEAPHRRVEKAGMQAAILVERLELFGKETRHQIDDLRGDVVHPGRQAVVDAVILDGALLESIERLEDLRAVVGLALVSGDVDPCPADPRAVADLRERFLAAVRVGASATKCGEAT